MFVGAVVEQVVVVEVFDVVRPLGLAGWDLVPSFLTTKGPPRAGRCPVRRLGRARPAPGGQGTVATKSPRLGPAVGLPAGVASGG